nr:MAG TPA: Ion transport protein N-terminal [Caudoviricetes sp.]
MMIHPFSLTGERRRTRITGYCLTEDVFVRV